MYGGKKLNLSIILMIIGIICIITSFFIKDSSKKIEKDLEELSISVFQETNSLKRRLKVVEEELLLEPNFQITPSKTSQKPNTFESFKDIAATQSEKKMPSSEKQINEILVRQVIELNKQGYPINKISTLSTLTESQIKTILRNHGGQL